jgi:hypothetical protein
MGDQAQINRKQRRATEREFYRRNKVRAFNGIVSRPAARIICGKALTRG